MHLTIDEGVEEATISAVPRTTDKYKAKEDKANRTSVEPSVVVFEDGSDIDGFFSVASIILILIIILYKLITWKKMPKQKKISGYRGYKGYSFGRAATYRRYNMGQNNWYSYRYYRRR